MTSSPRIGITGFGAISALGDRVPEHLDALRAGRSGIRYPDPGDPELPAGKPVGIVPHSNAGLQARVPHAGPLQTRSSLLALHAFREAVQHAGLEPAHINDPATALVIGTTVGGMSLTDDLYQDASGSQRDGSTDIQAYEYDFVAGAIRTAFGMRGRIATINTACSSSANAILLGARMLQAGMARRVIAGGVDSLAKFAIHGFSSLRLVTDVPCRPFDATRSGLNLGEGAAFLVLEREEDAGPARIRARLTGWGNSCDAHHPTSLSEQATGPIRSMEEALDCAGLSAQDIGYLNAHGTATENNDRVESIAIRQVLGPGVPFGSTKSYTGHTLGAAGALEAVICLLALGEQYLFSSLNFETPMEDPGLVPILYPGSQAMRHAMSNSFGFGGNCTSLIFSTIEP